MKTYKSDEELIEYLISKNVKIINKKDTLNKLSKYSYYSIINSYKNIFKNENNEYKDNVTFDEIFSLYEFDKNLKFIFLKYTLEIEVHIKSLIANQISKEYGIINYLNINNLDENSDYKSKIKLINKINDEIEDNYRVHTAVTHYKDKYGYVPPFVLTKILTFGVISSYYGLLKQKDRQCIAKQFNLSDKILKQILKNLTIVRNISAHSDRLYCFRSKYYISFKNIEENYNNKDNFTNLYMIIKCMNCLLDTKQKNEFNKEINRELKKISKKLFSIEINDILNVMGFPMNKNNL